MVEGIEYFRVRGFSDGVCFVFRVDGEILLICLLVSFLERVGLI